MRIGFDAKRAFFNFSGLGNYSRNIIRYLGAKFPDNDYYLYLPKQKGKVQNGEFEKHKLVYPESWVGKKFSSIWRSYWLGKRLESDRIDLYHGLSNEIPFDMPRPKVRSVVTIHDLIFMRFPEWYKPIDRRIYVNKTRHSCRKANRIIAISEQTSMDIQEYFGTSPDRIDVVYQGCDPAFYISVDDKDKIRLTEKYSLPQTFLLYVGTIEPRKNLLGIVQAMHMDSLDIPLIVIGRPTHYLEKVRQFIAENSMKNISFLQNVPNEDLPGLYQMAEIFIYPSRFEGFGIPILEALSSLTPVITSKGSCFPEAGGKHSAYIDPDSPEELASTIRKILDDRELQNTMKVQGFAHAGQFTEDIIAENVMKVYRKTI
ncbi:glycosyltransferase family 4 protein [Bacteroidota bacterium]